ncbi:hypothetical protein M3Y99_01212300 [Aphelenchoides fujianensis]|nr:hypothetical protein M3Y99_01212300 [Aphelenchoides fujianensis]
MSRTGFTAGRLIAGFYNVNVTPSQAAGGAKAIRVADRAAHLKTLDGMRKFAAESAAPENSYLKKQVATTRLPCLPKARSWL